MNSKIEKKLVRPNPLILLMARRVVAALVESEAYRPTKFEYDSAVRSACDLIWSAIAPGTRWANIISATNSGLAWHDWERDYVHGSRLDFDAFAKIASAVGWAVKWSLHRDKTVMRRQWRAPDILGKAVDEGVNAIPTQEVAQYISHHRLPLAYPSDLLSTDNWVRYPDLAEYLFRCVAFDVAIGRPAGRVLTFAHVGNQVPLEQPALSGPTTKAMPVDEFRDAVLSADLNRLITVDTLSSTGTTFRLNEKIFERFEASARRTVGRKRLLFAALDPAARLAHDTQRVRWE